MKILDGKKISALIKEEISLEVKKIISINRKRPHLSAILVGENGASQTYVNAKVKACEKVGFESTLIRLDNNITQEQLLEEINKININKNIDGLIVQLPLPESFDEDLITKSILPHKDVDGFHPLNIGNMVLNLPTFVSATPAGIIELLSRYNINTSGKHCVVLGRSNIVGTPMSILMSRKNNPGNATVTLAHSRTTNLKEICLSADILIVALGKANFITKDMIKPGACIIDVGITRVKSDFTKSGWKLVGDVNFKDVSEKCGYITPVPGGVGPMTIAMLLKNTLLASKSTF